MTYVNSIHVNPNSIHLALGTLYAGNKIQVEVSPENATNKEVEWDSSNPSVVSVNTTTGDMYACDIGSAIITATAKDGSGCNDTIAVHVSNTVPVEKVILSSSRLVLKRGESATLSATVSPDTASNKNVIWHSQDTGVATVANGRVLGIYDGVTTVTATAADGSGSSASCKVIVSNDKLVTEIRVTPSTITMLPGDTANITASVLPLDATNRAVFWSSDDPNVATFDPASGLVTAHKLGTTVIRATAKDISGLSDCCEIVVDSPYLVDHNGDEVVTFSYEKDGEKWLSKNFRVREFQCKDGADEIPIDMKLVRYLQKIRDWAGAYITITSGYRTVTHNADPSVGGAPNSMHLYGKAADIVCDGKTPLELAQKAEELEMPGIEWNKDSNYTHIDTRTNEWHVKRDKGVYINVDSFYDETE